MALNKILKRTDNYCGKCNNKKFTLITNEFKIRDEINKILCNRFMRNFFIIKIFIIFYYFYYTSTSTLSLPLLYTLASSSIHFHFYTFTSTSSTLSNIDNIAQYCLSCRS